MIGAAIAGTAALLQAGTGLAQSIKGKKIQRATVRPTYAIPDEIKANLKQAEQEATYGLDSASKQIATQGIDRSTASALYGGSSRRAGLAGMGGIVQAGNDAFANLAQMDAMEMARKKQVAMGARSEMAGYKDKEWQINKFDPYQLKMDEAQALIGAGMQNIGGAISTGASIGMTALDNQYRSSTDTNSDVSGMGANTGDMNKKAWWLSLTPEQRQGLVLAGKIKPY